MGNFWSLKSFDAKKAQLQSMCDSDDVYAA